MPETIDLILLTRDEAPPRESVRRGLDAQAGVRLRVHRVVGRPRPDDPNRWATIARARNAGRRLGTAPWVLFLDDDVVLEPGCVARLVEGLRHRPAYAALAADYLGELRRAPESGQPPRHVGMGATLFRRDVLAFLAFRWEPGKCECQCCCDDLRRAGFGIGYLPEARARHERSEAPTPPGPPPESVPAHCGESARSASPPRVLAAFDRKHFHRFRRQFLWTLRASGNAEPVTAVAYGLRPSERRLLAATPRVEVLALPSNGVGTPIRRLRDFQDVVARWPADTPVAYWDAGDVVFQDRLSGLWDLVRAHPDRLLAVREPYSYPQNPAVVEWTCTITDPEGRRRTFALLAKNPFLNSGFAAGTARALLRYLVEAHRLRHSSALRGTADWGDQTALNLYCHADPRRWLGIDEGWNYCLFMRNRGAYRVRPDGRVEGRSGQPLHVVHGNAKTLRKLEMSFFI
jgi:Glycosyl transferase family 2